MPQEDRDIRDLPGKERFAKEGEAALPHKEPLEVFLDFIKYLLEHKVVVGSALVVAVGITAGVTTYIGGKNREFDTAWHKIGLLSQEMGFAPFQSKDVKEKAYEDAIKEYKTLLETTSKNKATPWLIFQLGNAYYNSQKYDDAINTYRDFLSKYAGHPAAPLVRQALGYSCMDKGDFKSAIEAFKAYAEGGDNFCKAHEQWSIGQCYEQLGQKEEAIKSYKEVIALLPGSEWAELAQYRLEHLQ